MSGIQDRRARGRSRLERLFHFWYYFLDLYGVDGRPSHTKVLSAWGFFLALGAEVWWGSKAESLGDINAAYVSLVVATLAIPMGKGAFGRAVGVLNGKAASPKRAPDDHPKEELP